VPVSQLSPPPPPCTADSRHPQVLAALADNGKQNQTGRVDEYGALRHRIPELCGVGALAALFFAHFHILSRPVPDFAPDFTTSENGDRPWYLYHVFYPAARGGTPEQPMRYDSEPISTMQGTPDR